MRTVARFSSLAWLLVLSRALVALPSLVLSNQSPAEGEKMILTVSGAENPAHKLDWIGLYEEGVTPDGHPPSIW